MRVSTETVAGLLFPVDCAGLGRFGIARGTDKLEQGMKVILQTYPGERVMRPDFGCRLRDFVFEPITDSFSARLADEIERAITVWEPRVLVEDVEVRPDQSVDGLVQIVISYRVRSTDEDGEVVVVFGMDSFQAVAAVQADLQSVGGED